MAEVMHVGKTQHFGKLLAQANLHLVFGGIYAIFSQATWLDVAVQDDNFMAALGDFLGSKHSCWSCTNHKDSLHACPSNHSQQLNQAQALPNAWLRISFNCGQLPYYPLPFTHMLAQVSYIFQRAATS